jgi:hypothetical protein
VERHVFTGPSASSNGPFFPHLQKVDKELADALAALESEKDAALKNLDSQVQDVVLLALLWLGCQGCLLLELEHLHTSVLFGSEAFCLFRHHAGLQAVS